MTSNDLKNSFQNFDHFRALYPQLFTFWDQLSELEKEHLIQQASSIDFSLLEEQKQLLEKKVLPASQKWEPFHQVSFAGNERDRQIGLKRIQDGKVGCLLLAGGQGTRLRFSGPKGLYPVSLIKQKSLFQLFAEKVVAAGQQVGRMLYLAIMTSPENDAVTKQFFEEHAFWGLQKDQVFFFQQGVLPFLDANGQLFLEEKDTIAFGPNGNGFCLQEFMESGIGRKWQKQGIEDVNLVYIDNPLADPFDAELIGFHYRRQTDATIKCTEKTYADEKVGMLVRDQGHCRVVEYSEMPDQEKQQLLEDGQLKHRWAYIGLFCFSMAFIDRLVAKGHFPLHAAWKAAKMTDREGRSYLPDHPNAWKFEAFIFDLLAYTDRVAALAYPREHCFAPLKNATGVDSIETVRTALQNYDRWVLTALTQNQPPDVPFELSSQFYYPTPQLLHKWKGRSISGGYIDG